MAKIKVNTNELTCLLQNDSVSFEMFEREGEVISGIIPIFIASGKGHVKVDFTSPGFEYMNIIDNYKIFGYST